MIKSNFREQDNLVSLVRSNKTAWQQKRGNHFYTKNNSFWLIFYFSWMSFLLVKFRLVYLSSPLFSVHRFKSSKEQQIWISIFPTKLRDKCNNLHSALLIPVLRQKIISLAVSPGCPWGKEHGRGIPASIQLVNHINTETWKPGVRSTKWSPTKITVITTAK